MKAALIFGPGDIRVESMTDPVPDSGEVLVKVGGCGICGGDYSGHKPGANKAAQRREPTIAGHEVAGTVVARGSGVHAPAVGSRVAVSPNRPCGSCPPCHRGMFHLCQNRIPHPRHKGGGFAELTAVFPQQCYLIDEGTSMIEAAVTEPLACCLHSTSRIDVRQGDCVAIIGGGLNAQLFLQLTRLKGARRVVLIDSIEDRLKMASTLGADQVIDCSSVSFEEIERQFARGADVVINTRGSMEFTELAFRICAIGARLLCYGVARAGHTVAVEPHIIWRKEIQLIGGRSFNNTFGAAADLIDSRRIRVAPLITRTVNLERYAEVVAAPSRNHIKTVVVPDQVEAETAR